MESIELVLSVASQAWMALYVAVIIATGVVNVMTIVKGTEYSLSTILILTFLNIVSPIGIALTSDLWMFSLIGIAYVIFFIIIMVKIANMAVEDAGENDGNYS